MRKIHDAWYRDMLAGIAKDIGRHPQKLAYGSRMESDYRNERQHERNKSQRRESHQIEREALVNVGANQ